MASMLHDLSALRAHDRAAAQYEVWSRPLRDGLRNAIGAHRDQVGPRSLGNPVLVDRKRGCRRVGCKRQSRFQISVSAKTASPCDQKTSFEHARITERRPCI